MPEATAPKLNAKEILVLDEIGGTEEGYCHSFNYIMRGCGLSRSEVRRACRSLARKGLARYARGLFTEDGEVAGSGYGPTREGRELHWNLAAAVATA